MELNETQKLAVNSIDKNINLIAGAGTGKTRVLTSRFVKIILETKNVDRILAITFTKKAAEEMNSRISDELVKMGIDFSEEELNVKTIHSFCQELITENANLLSINPRFEIIEEESADELLSEAIRFVMKNYEQKDFEKYLVDFRSTIFQEEKNFKALYYEFKNKNLDYDDILKKSLEIKESKYTKEDLMEKVLSLSKVINGKKLKDFVKTDEFQKIFESDSLDNEDLKLISDNLGSSKKFADEIDTINEIIFNISLSHEVYNHDYYKIIIKILKSIQRKYSELKRDGNYLDYDDIMIYTSKLINLDSAKDLLRDRYDYILVDEYQDTNPLQNEIISKFESSNLFIVGDPKQSIYGFRGSDIKSYFEFAKKVEYSGTRLNMNINYRSDSVIINKINEIFENTIENYESIKSDVNDSGSIAVFNSEEQEDILELIKDLLKVYNLKDIAILTRSNNQVLEITELLNRENISFNTGSKSTEDIEVLSLITRLIELVISPKDNIKFLSLLNEPIIKLHFKDLIEVLLEDAVSLDDMKSINVNENIQDFLDFINYLIDLKNIIHLDEMVGIIIDKINSLNTLSSIEYEYLFQFKIITEDFVKKYGDDYRLFINYIKKQEFDDLEVGVNVLTIHKSKGLEFDAVIIANMDKSNLISNKNKIVVDKEVGLGIKSNFSTTNFERANRNLRDIDSEEEKRILYVAMTRAKKELVLFGNYEKSRPASFFSIIKDSGVEVGEYTFKREKLKSQDKTQHELFNFNKETEFRIREYYTVSDFLNFRRSPKEFYKKYFLGIDDYTNGNSEEKIMDPKLLGEIVHYFAKTNNKNDTSNSDIDLYIERIFNYYEEELNEDKFNLVKNLCLNYLSMEENDVLYKELLFYYNLDGYLVKGYIDAVIKIDDKYYIVDYKTNDADEEYLLKTYKPQVLIYSKIFESLYNIKINGAYIYDLRGSNKLKVETHDSEIASIMKEFSEFIDFTRKHIVYKDYIL